MLKYTKDDKTCQHQLEESLNTMLEVVRIVNNSMYEISIVGFQVSYSRWQDMSTPARGITLPNVRRYEDSQ